MIDARPRLASMAAMMVLALAPSGLRAVTPPAGGEPAARTAHLEPGALERESRFIKRVELRLPPGVDSEGLEDLVSPQGGEELRPGDLRRTVRVLYETGRFRQVRAHVRESPDGLLLTFVLEPRRLVAEVGFLGASAMSRAELGRLAAIERGDELSEQTLERAVRAIELAYERRGYLSAEVAPELREAAGGQVALVFRVVEGPASRLARVDWEGDPRLPHGELDEALGLFVGQRVALGSVEDALDSVRLLYRRAGHLRAWVGAPRIEPLAVPGSDEDVHPRRSRDVAIEPWRSVILAIPVQAGPVVRVSVEGNRLFDDERILQMLDQDATRPLGSEEAARGARRIGRAYRLAGHHHATVKIEEKTLGDGRLLLRVVVDEGPAMRVRKLSFDVRGDDAHVSRGPSVGWLHERVCAALEAVAPAVPKSPDLEAAATFAGGRPYHPASAPSPIGVPSPLPCEVFLEDAYARAREAIAEGYRRRGFQSVSVGEPRLSSSPDGRVAHVTIPIEEGRQTRVRSVAFAGAVSLDEAARPRTFAMSEGDPLSMDAVESGARELRAAYAASGHAFASVRPVVEIDDDALLGDVTYHVTEGPKVEVGRIIVRGHFNASASLVRRQLSFRSGDTWTTREVLVSQRRILSLGIFRSATIRLLDPKEPSEVMDVVVTVSERRPKAMEMGLGISTEDGPRVFADYVDYAFLLESELHANAKVNYPLFPSGIELRRVLAPGMEWEVQAGLRFPTRLSGRTLVVGERANRPTFGLTRRAWSLGADTRRSEALSASVGLELEYVDFETVAPDPLVFHPDRERRRFEEGRNLLASLRPGLVLDLRDSRVSPRRGLLARASIDWSHDLGVGVPVHFLRASGSISGYVPAGRGTTLALSARGGTVLPLSSDNVTIAPKRFYLGGGDTLRGFPLDGLVPADQREELHRQVEVCKGFLSDTICTDDALLVVREGRRPASAGGEAFVLLKGELRFPIRGGLFGGLFLDAGNLWRDVSNAGLHQLRFTAGGGIRHETPVGPVAVDLGWNLMPDRVLNELPVGLHFAIGLF